MKNIEIATNLNLWNEYVNPDKGMTDEEFHSLTVADRLAIMADCGFADIEESEETLPLEDELRATK